MKKQIKRVWQISKNYHTQEFYLKDDYLLHKNWFDPGKNPSKSKYTFNDILSGKQDYNLLIVLNIEPWILKEIKDNINTIIKTNENK